MPMLGDILIDAAREERVSYRNTVTEHAVEDGQEIADHLRRQPRTVTLSCTIAGPDWEERYERLKALADSAQLVSWVGAEVWENMAIEGFDPARTVQVANGVRFELTLRQVRVARVEERTFLAPDPVTEAPVEVAPVERGLQQPPVEEVDEETGASWIIQLGRSVAEVGGGALVMIGGVG